MNPANDLLNHLLRLGDSALVQGQRLCEWCGRAPALEEELALMNVGLDLVGQARNWLDYAAELLADGRDADHLAFRRDERAYRNLLLVEQPNGDFAVTMLKQFFYDAGTWKPSVACACPAIHASPGSPPRRSRKSPTTCVAPANGSSAWGMAPRKATGACSRPCRGCGALPGN